VKRLVLAGAGHAHALMLRDWARAPLQGVELVVVSPQPLAPYSGMVPGWLAGAYRDEQVAVDFPALCAAAGARWVLDEVAALDARSRRLWLGRGAALDYDLLSLNVGSTLRPPSLPHAVVLSMRPLSVLRQQWPALLEQLRDDPSREPLRVTAVGGGAAGFESLLAVRARLRQLRPDRPLQARLVSRGAQLLPALSAPARRAAQRELQRAGVELLAGTAWHDAMARRGEIVLWAAGAQAHDWLRDPLRRGGLDADADGFVRIDARLRSLSHPEVFAAGDCAGWTHGGEPALPKAGVYAVRMAPVLAGNLRASLQGRALQAYAPQRQHLVLLATGDGRAIASRGSLGASGRWVWWWKDRIDRGFVERFRQG
jgi:pyridine nucleotide-disulfide oxidoreductase family protein